MKQQEVFKKIGIIIKELNDQYEYLAANENELNDLELELFVANAHFLADHSEVLRKLSLQKPPVPATRPAPEEKFFEPVVQPPVPVIEVQAKTEESKGSLLTDIPPAIRPNNTDPVENPVPHIDLRGDDTGSDYAYQREEPEIIRHELTLDDVPNWNDEDDEPAANEELANPIIETRPVAVAKVEPIQPIREKPHVEGKPTDILEEPLTINQRISAQLNNTANRNTEHIGAQPIGDLKSAITLNDKLLYIKDLFNGYNLAYSEAIDILNRFNSFDEADKYLKSSYAIKNNWESKQSTVDKFYALLERRFA